MSLIYFFLSDNAQDLFLSNYSKFSFKICYLFFLKQNRTEFENFIKDFKKRIRPLYLEMEDFNNFVHTKTDEFSLEQNLLHFVSISIKEKPLEQKFLKKIIEYFKLIIEKNDKIQKTKLKRTEGKKKRKTEVEPLIIDVTNLEGLLGYYSYFLSLKYQINQKKRNVKIIQWNTSGNQYFELPNIFLDSTSQIILDLISNGFSTIQELREEYSHLKGHENRVSQPFISKYLSLLAKNQLIEEDWVDGRKQFYPTSKGYIHRIPSINKYIKKIGQVNEKELNKTLVPTSQLVKDLINLLPKPSEKKTEKTKIFNELFRRSDLTEKDIERIISHFGVQMDKKIYQLLKIGKKIHPTSAKILTYLAQYYYKKNDTKKAFSLCQKAIQFDTNHSEAWELLQKLVID